MSRKSVNRIAISAVMGGVATLALATPATAAHVVNPNVGSGQSAPATTAQQNPTTIPPSQGTGTEWQALPVAAGAIGGVALAGAAAGAFAGVRRRRGHLAHPA